MAAVTEALPPQLVGDIVAAVRLELAYWIPAFLEPLVEDLKKGKPLEKEAPASAADLSCLSPSNHVDSSRSSPAALHPSGMAGSSHEQMPVCTGFGGPDFRIRSQSWPSAEASCLPASAPAANGASSNLVVDTASGEAAKTGDQQHKAEPAALPDDTPVKMEIEMSTPLLPPLGMPEDCAVPHEGLVGWSLRHMRGEHGPDKKGNYHLIPVCDSTEGPASPTSPSGVMPEKMDDEDNPEITDPEAAKRLPVEITSLEEKAKAASETLEDLNALFRNRCRPYEEAVVSIHKEIDELKQELELARMPRVREPPPPGPEALKFVESGAFSVVCNLVVLLNLAAMIIGPKFESLAGILIVLDQVFLAWYVVELSANLTYYQASLLFGKLSFVWWNWLDLGIVVSGAVDQWLMPLLSSMNGGHLDVDTSSLRMLRTLRLFRIMRFLKIIKAFLKSDLAWTESTTFELWVAGVVGLNSVVMSMELDIPWAGWQWVENFFQIVYTFELAVRLKRQGCQFFLDMSKFDSLVWNYLDFVMVSGGFLDLWLVPLIYTLWGIFFGSSPIRRDSSFSGFLKILKIMRILRVLRLVRLLKVVKPLYRLITGVIQSIKAMQWVLILTFLTLYACSIIFTNLVGEGILTGGEVTALAFEYFGSVSKSLFHLFRLMNGDISVVEPITDSALGKLLFIGFTVVSKWAILAILTSVVSDNMITSSQKANEEDEQRKNEVEHEKRIRRLTALFKEIDCHSRGIISTTEWQRMLQDESLHRELCDVTGLHEEDLNDYFECLAKDPKLERSSRRSSSKDAIIDLRLDYRTFIEALKDEGQVADKRSILHVMKQLRILESHVKKEFEELGVGVEKKEFRRSMSSNL